MSWTPLVPIEINGVHANAFKNGALRAIVSQDPPDQRWHLSISHASRYPTWDEIRDARYDLLPDDITMAMLLPPKSEYVNAHSNCFHLHEWKDELKISIPL